MTAHDASAVSGPPQPGAHHADLLAALHRLAPGPDRDALRGEIICLLMPMARRLARRFRNRGESDDDLLQVAALGLIQAVDRFDPARGHAFETFAVPTIVGELRRHFRDHGWDVHVPRRTQEARNAIRRARDELLQPLTGREPTIAEVAAHTGLSEEEVRRGIEADHAYSAYSLDVPASLAGWQPLADTVGREDGRLALVVDRQAVGPLLRALPYRERRILFLHFYQNLPQHQIARAVGISQMHVSRLLNRTCAAIRHQVLGSR